MWRVSLSLAACAVALSSRVGAQADVSTLVARAVAYVESFHRDFGSMVAEERYEQAIRQSVSASTRLARVPSGPVRTVLVSDFLLVQVPGEGWLPFRDVFEHDGEKVRDRDERLAALFLTGSRSAMDQARTIMDEGARYNIGNVNRNINVPTLPLQFLTSPHPSRFSFTIGKRDEEFGVALEYKETSRPTFVATTGGRDLPVSGRFWVDEETGTVRRTELHAVDTSLEAHITVTYERDPGTRLWFPAKMEERYKRRLDPVEVHGLATYSKFRRFQVSTSEEIAR
jgi:hypothetical protein